MPHLPRLDAPGRSHRSSCLCSSLAAALGPLPYVPRAASFERGGKRGLAQPFLSPKRVPRLGLRWLEKTPKGRRERDRSFFGFFGRERDIHDKTRKGQVFFWFFCPLIFILEGHSLPVEYGVASTALGVTWVNPRARGVCPRGSDPENFLFGMASCNANLESSSCLPATSRTRNPDNPQSTPKGNIQGQTPVRPFRDGGWPAN